MQPRVTVTVRSWAMAGGAAEGGGGEQADRGQPWPLHPHTGESFAVLGRRAWAWAGWVPVSVGARVLAERSGGAGVCWRTLEHREERAEWVRSLLCQFAVWGPAWDQTPTLAAPLALSRLSSWRRDGMRRPDRAGRPPRGGPLRPRPLPAGGLHSPALLLRHLPGLLGMWVQERGGMTRVTLCSLSLLGTLELPSSLGGPSGG
jgi:hypothetical protein